jgi:hypothetical protein
MLFNFFFGCGLPRRGLFVLYVPSISPRQPGEFRQKLPFWSRSNEGQ